MQDIKEGLTPQLAEEILTQLLEEMWGKESKSQQLNKAEESTAQS